MADETNNVIWVHSNRVDDRVVLFERDDLHPGGEAFIGGSVPAKVYKTPEVMRLLREGLIVEIPEPPDKIDGEDNRKKPIPLDAAPTAQVANQPGQRIELGRKFDPEIVPASAQKSIQDSQAKLPDNVPVPSGTVVPPPTPSQTDTGKR